MQHELAPGFAVNVGYFRTWFGNFTVTDNVAVGPSDYDPFCITAPTNAGLLNSGQRICGLYDIKPEKFGQVQNQVVRASKFGTPRDVFNGVDVTVNARIRRGVIVSGGLSTGSEMTDYCFTVDSPGTGFSGFNGTTRESGSYQCHIAPPWSAGTQVKLSAVYPLPYYFQVSANFQSIPGPVITASYAAAVADVQKTLGRPLSGGARNVTVNLISPGTQYDTRINQLDARIARTFRVGRRRSGLIAACQPDVLDPIGVSREVAPRVREWRNNG